MDLVKAQVRSVAYNTPPPHPLPILTVGNNMTDNKLHKKFRFQNSQVKSYQQARFSLMHNAY